MSDIHYISFSAPATFVGATVTAIVYTTITATGDIAASATGTGIELTGTLLGYGTELLAGPHAGNTIRSIARTYSAVARPAITATSRFGAIGISALAGTGAALTTNAIWYGGEKLGYFLYSYYKDYKQKIIENLQSSNPITEDIILIEDNDIILIEDNQPSPEPLSEPLPEPLLEPLLEPLSEPLSPTHSPLP